MHTVAELLKREHAQLDETAPSIHAAADVLGITVKHRLQLVVQLRARGPGAGVESASADNVVLQGEVLAGDEAAAGLYVVGMARTARR